VTTLVNQTGPSRKKKGRSKKAHVLCAAIQKATEHFIENGDDIANENPEIRNDMLIAINDVRTAGWIFIPFDTGPVLTWFYCLKGRQLKSDWYKLNAPFSRGDLVDFTRSGHNDINRNWKGRETLCIHSFV